MGVHIGTSGWAYPEWKPAFYPADLPQRRFLEHYATRLSACEVNGTYYRVPSRDAVDGWLDATPEEFRFAIKAPKAVTHGSTGGWSAGARRQLDRLLAAIAPAGDRVGAILLRFPDHLQYDEKLLAAMLAGWPSPTPPVFDFRQASWLRTDVLEAVGAAGGTVCGTDTAGEVLPSLPPGPIAYARLRAEHYSAAARDGWRGLLLAEGARRPVMAFARHEGIPAGDPFAGVGLADWLCSSVADAAV